MFSISNHTHCYSIAAINQTQKAISITKIAAGKGNLYLVLLKWNVDSSACCQIEALIFWEEATQVFVTLQEGLKGGGLAGEETLQSS